MIFIILAVIAAAVILVAVLASAKKTAKKKPDPVKDAGNQGEDLAYNYVRKALNEDDVILRNVTFSYEGKDAELDLVVLNAYGAFIIEVKNYVGSLVGGEDDFEWEKYKVTDAGNVYEKPVKNPIKQVKRQIYLLAGHLKKHGIPVWVRGYALFINGNCPIRSEYVPESLNEMRRLLHTPDGKQLNRTEILKAKTLLKG